MATAIQAFVDNNLLKNKSLSAVRIAVKEFKLTETALPNGSIDGKVKLVVSYGFIKDYGVEHLVDYNGGLRYTRPSGITANTEPYLRNVLKNGLVYLDKWMNANVETNRKLAKNVNISFYNYTEPVEGDTIYYSSKRPLTWDDFQSKYKPSGKYNAEIMPGFGYDQQGEIVKGTINVKLALKVYVAKSSCWADNYGRNAYALLHEQHHFDITRIVAEHFKQSIATANLTPDTYEAFINMQYLDSYREMNAMQKAYDKETSHSRNIAQQNAWNERIETELKQLKIN